MSALAISRHVRRNKSCPLYPPKADMCSATRYVRFVPIADIALFDHLVGAQQNRLWDDQAQRFRCLEV